MTEQTFNQQAERLKYARTLLDSKDYDACLPVVTECWLAAPDDKSVIALFTALMRACNRLDLVSPLEKLLEDPDAGLNDQQILFDIGYLLIDERMYSLAVMVLIRLEALAPDEPIVSYELGFALMALRRFSEAIARFESACQHKEDFDTVLNLAACLIATRELKRTEKLLQRLNQLASSDEEKREVREKNLVARRLQQLSGKKVLTSSDWLYIQYGTVLLEESSASPTGKFEHYLADYGQVASILLLLRGLLEEIGISYEVIEYYSPLSRPLAECLGLLMDLPVEGYGGPQRDQPCILIMAWASDIIGPHESFIRHEENRSIFAFGLTSLEHLPVAPDIAGVLTASCAMPWSERYEIEEFTDGRPASIKHFEGDDSPALEIAELILEKTRDLESDVEILKKVKALADYYRQRKPCLTIANPSIAPFRPQYTAEVPE